jgi:putative aldouronate transport system substrate-binding protein
MKKALLVFLSLLVATGLVLAADDTLVNGKFKTTHKITVEVYDRSNDGGSKPEDNFYTDYIKQGMLRDHNVEVTFVRVPRWTEVQAMNNLLAAGDAPDVCVTYDYPTILTYANMGGVLDLGPFLTKYKAQLGDLWKLLGDTNIYNNRDPKSGNVFAIEGMRFQNMMTSTFVREDWLKKLKLKEPTTLKEFEAMLVAFQKNASALLGADAAKIIPFALGVDVGWGVRNLAESFIPDKAADDALYIRSFDDRHLLWPNYKEAIRVVNKWYNDGLIWKDFPLYPVGDKTQDNLTKAGYVGAFIGNWDIPYRDGDNSFQASIKKLQGPDAAYIAVDCFKNDAGKYRKFLGATTSDRKLFFPATNDEPVASLLYLNWISKLENRKFLQIGEEGVTHVTNPDGSVKITAVKGEKIQNSGMNIDYTITINGLDLGDPSLTAKSLALSYAGIEAKYIEKSYLTQRTDGRVAAIYNLGKIDAEEGMGPVETEKRNNMLTQAVVAKTKDFDKVFDAGLKDILDSGVQAIINERQAKYNALFGKK